LFPSVLLDNFSALYTSSALRGQRTFLCFEVGKLVGGMFCGLGE